MSLWAMYSMSYTGLNICTRCEQLTTTEKLICGHFLCEKCRNENQQYRGKCLVCYDWNGKKWIFRTPEMETPYQLPVVSKKLRTGVNTNPANTFALLNVKDIEALTEQRYENERSIQLQHHHDIASFQELRRKLEEAKNIIKTSKTTVHVDLCHEIIAMVTAGDHDVIYKNNDVIVEDIVDIAKLLSQNEDYQSAFSLLYCNVHLCTQMRPSSGKAKLLQRIAGGIHSIAVLMVKKGQIHGEFNQVALPLLDKILTLIRSNNLDVTDADDVTGSRFHEIWCLKYVALCSKYLGDYDRSISANLEAIFIADDVISSDVIVSKEYDVTLVCGMCHQNLASVYQTLGDVEKAKEFFTKAIKVYSSCKNSSTGELMKGKIQQCETALRL